MTEKRFYRIFNLRAFVVVCPKYAFPKLVGTAIHGDRGAFYLIFEL
jgi:hypothetical protein